MCGGWINGWSDKCYGYSPESDSWVELGTMKGIKGNLAYHFTETWGLVMAQYGQQLEVTKNGEEFETLAEYPNPDVKAGSSGCIVAVDDSQLFLAGGGLPPSRPASNRAFLFNKFGNSWTELTSMLTGRYGHSCGVVNNEIVVAGGRNARHGYFLNSVEIFSLEAGTWRQGNYAFID